MSPAVALLTCLTMAFGLVLVGSGTPGRRSPRLAARLDPYLRGLEPRSTHLLETEEAPLVPFPMLDRLLRPILDEGGQLVERCLGGATGVSRRLREAGLVENVPRFRAEQMLWGLSGFAAGSVIGLAVLPALSGGAPAVAGTSAGILGLLGGVLGRDWRLTRQVERRQARMVMELPALADLICIAVTAGEAPRAAIERVVARSHGELSRELGLVLADLRTGVVAALERLAARVPVRHVVRFVDGLVVAVERGTPLADVLRAQATDVREQHKRELIEAGGRREVYMLVPVVFMVMPVVVLFALYPGFLTLIEIAR